MMDILLLFVVLVWVCWMVEDTFFKGRVPYGYRHKHGICGKRKCEACD